MIDEPAVSSRPPCPGCGEPWLRPTNLPGRYRCVYCLRRYELRSDCPDCGAANVRKQFSVFATHGTAEQPSFGASSGGGCCGGSCGCH